MSRRSWVWLMTMAMLALLVVLSAPAFPATQEPAAEDPAEETPADDSAVEQILREQEALITGQMFSYDPGGRRDPFRSPYENLRPKGGKRPAGAAGMLVTEVDLVGVVRDAQGDVAMVMGSDNKSYFMRVGDAVFDGTVIAIDSNMGTVTFRQQLSDPRLIKPYRDIVKRLVPLDEESADE